MDWSYLRGLLVTALINFGSAIESRGERPHQYKYILPAVAPNCSVPSDLSLKLFDKQNH